MKNQVYIVLVISFLIQLEGISQQALKYDESFVVQVEENAHVAVATTPITNRDYLTYLVWNLEVFGADYSGNVIRAIPNVTRTEAQEKHEEMYHAGAWFAGMKSMSNERLTNYLLNPKYIDYPVVGLRPGQAMEFMKWLGDRYNEYVLFQKKHYQYSNTQINEDNFGTEAYLGDQYYGQGRLVDGHLTWADSVLIPAFRGPCQTELEALPKKHQEIEIRSYANDRKLFLKPWNDAGMTVTDDQITFHYWSFLNEGKGVREQVRISDFDLKKIEAEEFVMTGINGEEDYPGMSSSYGWGTKTIANFVDDDGYVWEKDSVGRLGYNIIDSDQAGNPVLLSQYQYRFAMEQPANKNFVYRYAVNIRHIGRYKQE